MLHSVARYRFDLQQEVAQRAGILATFCSMASWKDWRTRVKQWKKDNELDDADIAESVGRKRATINSWLNKREPNLSDFMALCEAMGADPGHILFEQPSLRGDAAKESAAHRVMSASPTAEPGHREFVSKLRRFKQNRRRTRRVIVKA